jgi:hypothetical protein
MVSYTVTKDKTYYLFTVLLCFLIYLNYINGHINKQNTKLLSEENPHAFQQAHYTV